MAFCPECNHEIPAAASVCSHCGYDFPLDDPKPIAGERRWEMTILGAIAAVALIAGVTLNGWVEEAPRYAQLTLILLGLVCLYCGRAFWWLDGRIARLEADATQRRRQGGPA